MLLLLNTLTLNMESLTNLSLHLRIPKNSGKALGIRQKAIPCVHNTDDIKSNSDITDKTSSMQAMRDTYNPHTHTGNQGSPTSAPNKTM